MKRMLIVITAVAALLPSIVFAESYSALWNKFKDAQNKDLPKTELAVLKSISSKAIREKSYGHLLKAQVLSMTVLQNLSPDSLLPAIDCIVAAERAASATDMVLAHVYRSVLGKIYSDNVSVIDSAKQKSEYYFKRSLENPDVLAKAYSAGFEPFVLDGVDSRVFGDDLLHVIGFAAGEYRFLHDYYLAKGNRAAACLCALHIMREKHVGGILHMHKSKYVQCIDSLIDVYGDLPEAGELAIERYGFMENSEDATTKEKINYIDYALTKWGAWPRMNILRNSRRKLTLPSFHVSIGEGLSVPGEVRQAIVMSACNIGELTMTVRRININGNTKLSPSNKDDYAKLKKFILPGIVQRQTKHYVGKPEYMTSRDTMNIKGLPVGVYLVEFSCDNVKVPVERMLFRVSDLYVVTQQMPSKNIRMAVLSATTGMPVPGAKIRVDMGKSANQQNIKILTCDQNGEATLSYTSRGPTTYYAYTDTDKAFPEVSYSGYFSYYGDKSTDHVKVFTDRSIYRPGQTVKAVAWVYKYNKSSHVSSAMAHKTVTFTLRDANFKEIATRKVVTDEYGMVSAEFVLPSSGLSGLFSLNASCGRNDRKYFSVEEYKRPTFSVVFDKIKTQYRSGDTVTVKGWAKSFAGVAVQGARVACQVIRRPSLLWRIVNSPEPASTIIIDTVRTSADGSFELKVPVEMPEAKDDYVNRYYSFDVRADVTDAAGETRYGELSIPLSDRPTAFSCEIPELVERDSIRNIVFLYKNNAGESINGDVTYYVGDNRHTCKANTPVPLPTKGMASGKYNVTAYCGNDTLSTSFILFSLDDKKAVIDTHDWFYLTSEKFKYDGSVYLQAGSSDSILHVMYTMISGDRIIENGSIDLHGGLLTRELKYQEAYGDGLTITYAWVKNGKLYTHSASIERPMPDKRLIMKWTTFRDRLVPGQKEEWTLNISKPDGSSAEAQLMAVLYDKSLDGIRYNQLGFNLPSYLNLPYISWIGSNIGIESVYGEMPFKPFVTRELEFSQFLINRLYFTGRTKQQELYTVLEMSKPRNSGKHTVTGAVTTVKLDANATSGSAKLMADSGQGFVNKKVNGEEDSKEEGFGHDTANQNNVGLQTALRENMSETAFFYPGLSTDEKGNVKLKFTLPESITTWRFIGLAHDKSMNNGMLEGVAVAKKTVMIQPNMPRFVRHADRATITARIFNTSEHDVDGTAICQFICPETNKVVFENRVKYEVKQGESTVVPFAFDMNSIDNDGLLICRVMAAGKGYSDGEQHYLPVMPGKEMVTNTMPFTQNEVGILKINVDSLFAVKDKTSKLTVEYTDNPAWFMIQALPVMTAPTGDDAISLAASYYANKIGQDIMKKSPAIKATIQQWQKEGKDGTSLLSSVARNEDLKSLLLSETPWVLDAEHETEQKHKLLDFFDESAMGYRLAEALAKLQKLQNDDGSFSWWNGMDGSSSMTLSVAEMLVRVNNMVGRQAEVEKMLESAFGFMKKRIASEVKELKKELKKGAKKLKPSEFAVNYLYVRTLDGQMMDDKTKTDYDFLVELLEEQNAAFSLYGKAIAAVVMAKNKRTTKAAELLESIKEYTVYQEQMGRYFDTPKALYSWFDYRIPTQTAAIEALKILQPEDKKTIGDMQRWLLQCKRTQSWDTPVNSVNAVYAFLDGNEVVLDSTAGSQPVLKIDGKRIDLPKATAGLGYVKIAKKDDSIKSLTIGKSSTSVSWGAAYAQFMQSVDDVEAASAGLTVKRELIVDGRLVDSDRDAVLRVGDKVVVRITVIADRDYDFVELIDKRAACLEHEEQLSGYRRGYYCSPKDNSTNYYFDRLPKGKHVIESIYYVDRAGDYHTGTCVVQCAYSPEFSARDSSLKLHVSE